VAAAGSSSVVGAHGALPDAADPRRGRVVVFGSVNVDVTSYVRSFPAPGETVHSHGFAIGLGGKGANQAVAAHLAGARVELVARLGDDPNASVALGVFARFGLPVSTVERMPRAATGVAQITVADSGENTIVVTAGANELVTPEVVHDERERIAAADIVLTQGELPVATIERLAAECGMRSIRFVLNLAPPVSVSAAALAVCDPLVVNEHEARAAGIGAAVADDAPVEAWRDAAAAAVGTVARSVVVTLGPAGAVAASSEGAWVVPASRVDAVDTTGAGDAATGTLAAMLAEGRPLPEALRIAVAAGTLAVQGRGTVDSYASRAEVLAAASPASAVEPRPALRPTPESEEPATP
jgi:ribokinase